MLLEKEDLLRLVSEIHADPDTPLEEDLATWGIDADGLMDLISDFSSLSLRQAVIHGRPLRELQVLGLNLFMVGYKCALEMEMQRIANA